MNSVAASFENPFDLKNERGKDSMSQTHSLSPLSLDDYAMDIIQTNADFSSIMVNVRRLLKSLDRTPDFLPNEMLHLAEHLQHLQCSISDATYFEKKSRRKNNNEMLPTIYARIFSFCQLVRTVKEVASNYVDSIDSISYDLESCFDSLNEICAEYEALLNDLDKCIDAVEKVIPKEIISL